MNAKMQQAANAQDAKGHDPRRAIRKLNIIGFSVVALLVGGVGVWAATTELSGAVIASGSIIVESSAKKVQHPTGGIVGEITVKEGGSVQEGQVVIRLDDTVPRSTLGVLRSQLDELVARETRLLAERDVLDTLTFPEEIAKRRTERSVSTAIAGEERLFESRRTARVGQRSQLRERISQSNEEIRGLTAQQDAKEKEIKFIGEELGGVSDLYNKNLVTIVRYMQLQRDHAKVHGERGQFIAEIARARAKISETELQIIQLDQDFRTEVLKDLREAQGRIAELRERLIAAEDQLKRVDIRAPQAGIVHQLTVHTVGGVIGNGETIMLIVPQGVDLVVEAKVAPRDIDQVQVGARATVRVMAGNQRTTPDINGAVTLVAADITQVPNQPQVPPYYVVRISLPESEVSRLDGLKLAPGMQVESFIQTHPRTPLDFLLKPLNEQIARAFRER